MKKRLLALAMVFALLAALTGCAQPGDTVKLVVYNWEDYIDPTVLSDFETETGIKIDYQRFTTNEDMYIKMTRGGVNYDVIFPSDYMIERMIEEDLIAPLDHSKLTNLDDTFAWLLEPGYDPGSQYSAPYMWGTVGIIYNIEMTGKELTSWNDMWDLQYKNQVCMMDSIRDTMGVALKKLGFSMNTRDEAELAAARDTLIEQKQSGVVLAYGVDDIKDKLINGECAIGLVWSGDAIYAMAENEDLRYCVPVEGSNIWVDGMVIPKSSKNVDAAHEFINFMLRPEIAARNTEYIGYSTPCETALDLVDEEMVADPAYNPPQEVIDRCEWFHDLPQEYLTIYERMWTEVTA